MPGKLFFISDDESKIKRLMNGVQDSDWTEKYANTEDFMTPLSLEGADCILLHLDKSKIKREADYVSEIHSFDDNLPVIVLSDKGKLESAVDVMKEGAYDYFATPFDSERLSISIKNALRLYDLTKKVYFLEQQGGWVGRFDDIIGQSQKMQDIFKLVTTVAKSNATVLILGESGTGKELIAKAIHRHSKRAQKSFIDINCGAIPKELLENELFGHEKGSYTGADRQYIGSCERADKGTLFLDEICEMEPGLQVKILRLLQDRSFNRVGGVTKITSDIRFVAATNKKIEDEVANGNFREDLYYRLNVVPITLPPLRDRKEDILALTRYFLEKFSTKNEKIFVDVEPDAAECMLGYNWPGNVRELENSIERIVVLNNDARLKYKHLPENIKEYMGSKRGHTVASQQMGDGQKIVPLELVEKYAIEAAVNKCSGNIAEAAKKLKIGQATIYRKLKQYGWKTK